MSKAKELLSKIESIKFTKFSGEFTEDFRTVGYDLYKLSKKKLDCTIVKLSENATVLKFTKGSGLEGSSLFAENNPKEFSPKPLINFEYAGGSIEKAKLVLSILDEFLVKSYIDPFSVTIQSMNSDSDSEVKDLVSSGKYNQFSLKIKD